MKKNFFVRCRFLITNTWTNTREALFKYLRPGSRINNRARRGKKSFSITNHMNNWGHRKREVLLIKAWVTPWKSTFKCWTLFTIKWRVARSEKLLRSLRVSSVLCILWNGEWKHKARYRHQLRRNTRWGWQMPALLNDKLARFNCLNSTIERGIFTMDTNWWNSHKRTKRFWKVKAAQVFF